MAESQDEMPQNVLVAVDFSPHAMAALKYAANMSKCIGTNLTILHVVHDLASSPGYYASKKIKGEKKILRRLEEIAEEMMDEFLAKLIKENPELKSMIKKSDVMLVSGLTVTKILQVVEKLQPQLLVMGNKGRSGLKNILMGSKAEQVIKLCPIPVTIVKG